MTDPTTNGKQKTDYKFTVLLILFFGLIGFMVYKEYSKPAEIKPQPLIITLDNPVSLDSVRAYKFIERVLTISGEATASTGETSEGKFYVVNLYDTDQKMLGQNMLYTKDIDIDDEAGIKQALGLTK